MLTEPKFHFTGKVSIFLQTNNALGKWVIDRLAFLETE